MFEAARVPTFRLISTGDRPELELAKGHKWHLFLSHIWGTGQDQCATIKRQLCLLLPGVSVFLDVDDLEDIGDLEKYVDQSSLIMIFVSKGYFLSNNCLREVRCASSKTKPLSLMHDPVRGGATLKGCIEECPVEVRGYVFDDRPVITYHRARDFQVVTMKLLAQQLLRECPNFKSAHASSAQLGSPSGGEGADVQLILPGEVSRRKLRFRRPITVYVSPYNPGAARAIEALQEGFRAAASRRSSSIDGTAPVASRTRSGPIRSTDTRPAALALPGGSPTREIESPTREIPISEMPIYEISEVGTPPPSPPETPAAFQPRQSRLESALPANPARRASVIRRTLALGQAPAGTPSGLPVTLPTGLPAGQP